MNVMRITGISELTKDVRFSFNTYYPTFSGINTGVIGVLVENVVEMPKMC
jgi:hypothetical protein